LAKDQNLINTIKAARAEFNRDEGDKGDVERRGFHKSGKSINAEDAACHGIAEGDDGSRLAGRPLIPPFDALRLLLSTSSRQAGQAGGRRGRL